MRERKLVRKFTLDTEIYDANLPQKVSEVLQAEPLETNPCLFYGMDVIFDKAAYQTAAFFQYPLEKLPLSPPNRRSRMREQELLRERVSAILDQQLSKISAAVKSLGIDLCSGAIIGDDLAEPHVISIEFYEVREKEYDSKGRLKQLPAVNSIMPDRPYFLKTAVELFAKMAVEYAEKDAKKEREQAAHTPHMVRAGELFTSTAKAVLLDYRRKKDAEIAALAEQLRLHADIQTDWPLEIISEGTPKEPIPADFEIDCPEFLLYQEDTRGNWTLKKVENLGAAQYQITKRGYNLTGTARMAVLHNLQPVGFTLFAETAEGLVRVRKQDAAGKKNLHLSWNSRTAVR